MVLEPLELAERVRVGVLVVKAHLKGEEEGTGSCRCSGSQGPPEVGEGEGTGLCGCSGSQGPPEGRGRGNGFV